MTEECKHKWFTRSNDDFCYCILCHEEWDEYNERERKKYNQKMGATMKRIRKNLNLSQQKFALFLGVDSARTIRYYESGERKMPIWVSNKIIELDDKQLNGGKDAADITK